MSCFQHKEAYVEKYEEMDWFPLDSYIKKVAGEAVCRSLGTQQRKIEFVNKELGLPIDWDNGEPGVTVRVHDDGRKRIRAGSKTGLTKRQTFAELNDAEGVEQKYQNFQSGIAGQFSQAKSLEQVSSQWNADQMEEDFHGSRFLLPIELLLNHGTVALLQS